ncbi:MAG TPA: thymidine phosphorylase, partial [Microlunatus sp.]|nr:thymidine phosphorylase [Microlunatus sp.]
MLAAVSSQLDDAEGRVTTGGETGDAHPVTLSTPHGILSRMTGAGGRSGTEQAQRRHEPYEVVDLINGKRRGERLSDAEVDWVIDAYTRGAVADEQMSALAMAIAFQGLAPDELQRWTDAMIASGERLDFSGLSRPTSDKHSTGGVGDKITLPLAPLVAACGVAVPQLSGRGLGHTGGTLDKLEAIPGFRVDLDIEQFIDRVDRIGVCLIGQTERLAPADRRLYALRDVTATVESIPLIASSIMSKKLAEGIDALVLDCKVGTGAFMKRLDDARALAQAIRVIGQAAGKRVSVMLTVMDAPIGTAVGNANEVLEAIEVLRGRGPADTRELTVRLGGEMLYVTGAVSSEAEGIARVEQALDSGAGLEVFRRLVEAQGGDARVVDDPAGVLPQAPVTHEITAERSGYVAAIDSLAVGMAASALGAGRQRTDDQIDHAVGVDMVARVGDAVSPGQVLARMPHRHRGLERAVALMRGAFSIDDKPVR